MATTTRKKSAPAASTTSASEPLPPSVKDSAQQIWQAGLGAFTRAQAEGSKAFEALVQEGVNMQRKTQAAAEERIADATHKMTSMANELSSKATGQWDKLENIFEDRVAKALHKLGVPSAKDVDALIARIEALNQTVQALVDKAPPRKSKAPSAAKPAAKPATQVGAKALAKVPAKAKPRKASSQP
jgi:poly(hydroxyalkanoate) granule-associated protein